MIKSIITPLLFLSLTSGFFSALISPKSEPTTSLEGFAPKGMVAYAASYSSDITDEPQFSAQNSKTFQYLNLGRTLSTFRGDLIKVGIIDSGINYDHEDFMVNNQTKVKGASKFYTIQNSSWVYYSGTQHGYSYLDDTLGHGTNVAATVAAAINGVGGLGLAPNVELYVYKVTNTNNGYEFGAIQNALLDAKTLGIDVVNMSFQSYEHAVSYGSSSMAASSGCSTVLSYYLNQAYNAGITLVGAAGNFNTSEPSYPGSNNHVINVGSLNQDGTGKASFSNYGSTIDLVAPGYVHVADKGTNSSYKDTQGTSFSAPLVTAAIALYKQKFPNATPSEIETALYASCDPIEDTNWAGHGALNVARFLGLEDVDGPTDITINNPEVINGELCLEVGETLTLDYTVNGVGTFDDSVNFYTLSGEESVVSIDSIGKITAVGEGEEYICVESNVNNNVYADIYVTVTAPSVPKVLNSITVETSPNKTTYLKGEYFSPTGLVIRRHYTDSTSDTYSYANHTSEFTFDPSLSTVLKTTDTVVTIYYGGLSCAQSITVNSYRQVIEVINKTGSYNFSNITSSSGSVLSSSQINNYWSSQDSVSAPSITNITKIIGQAGFVGWGSNGNAGSATFTFGDKVVSVTINYTSWSATNITITNCDTISISSSTSPVKRTLSIPVTTVTIATNNRLKFNSLTFELQGQQTDISQSEDCIGLESFISTYMHMDYVDNLGYCKDNEHHYYSSAKAAFNSLNAHQRSLFTSNSAYAQEWARLNAWATFNGDKLNSSNLLAISNHSLNDYRSISSTSIIVVVVASSITLLIGFNYYLFKKRKH